MGVWGRVLALGLLLMGLAGCAAEPEVLVVEITRVVSEVQEIEVTRLVEVTRVVPSADGVPANVSGLASLQVELWPDYDRPSVLVLLTGQVPAGAPLPAILTIPLPEGAEINAVAEVGPDRMTSIDFEERARAVVFESEAPQFRVEYYVPYEREGSERRYEFEWLAPFYVSEMLVLIQKPAKAIELASEPGASEIFTEPADGLDYYRFNTGAASAGTAYGLRFRYDMESDELTADVVGGSSPDQSDEPLHGQQA